jgi:fused signal recognition particle receptor
MVFNWFRRQFTDKNKTEEKPTPPPAPTPEQTEAKKEEQSEESADEYLQWAKAAYQNIQQQQVPSTTQAEATEPETTAPASEAGEDKTDETPVDSVVESPEAEKPAPVEEVPQTEAPDQTQEIESVESTPEIESAEVPTPEAIAEEPAPVVREEETPVETEAAPPEAETETETEPEAPAVPFWAKAEAERQERLKQLAETAMDTPVEEDFTKPATKAAPPEMELDEEFLWSAEVLARQGRRPDEVSLEEINWLQKLRQGLDKTRLGLINQLKAIVGAGPLNREAVMEIEAALLQADVGIEATDYIIEALQTKLKEEALPPKEAIAYLKTILRDILDAPTQDSETQMLFPEKGQLNIWLISGVNGAGKTTTIGKLAHLAQKSGYKALIAAADTFRAAAVEQVTVWGERSGVEVIANPGKNTDPAAVVFDAIAAAQSRGTELLLVDTAGRLQNKKNLMEELSKIRRIIEKKAPNTIVESLIVLDATLGQNGLRQAQIFSEAIKLSGVILTKLDGTAKGGIALAVSQQMGLPIRFIGAGEGIDDLRPFSSYEFVEAMLNG